MKYDKQIVEKIDSILARGLCSGVGNRDGQMCVEAAVCAALDLPHGDDPGCVAASVRSFKISLNDSRWSSPKARADGLRNLAIAQLGSLGVIDDEEFAKRIAEKSIRVLIPQLFRELGCSTPEMKAAADRCEWEGTEEAAREARAAANAAADAANAAANAANAAAAANAAYAAANAAYAAADAANAAANAAYAAYAANAAYAAYAAANAAAYAANAAANAEGKHGDRFLILSAQIALEVLKELKSPGCELL
jgi:hypothetical protein